MVFGPEEATASACLGLGDKHNSKNSPHGTDSKTFGEERTKEGEAEIENWQTHNMKMKTLDDTGCFKLLVLNGW